MVVSSKQSSDSGLAQIWKRLWISSFKRHCLYNLAWLGIQHQLVAQKTSASGGVGTWWQEKIPDNHEFCTQCSRSGACCWIDFMLLWFCGYGRSPPCTKNIWSCFACFDYVLSLLILCLFVPFLGPYHACHTISKINPSDLWPHFNPMFVCMEG